MNWRILSLLVAVRVASVFVVRTYYVADEYWQSLEVAHKLAFGYGYLTWEWIKGIRSYIYPLFIAAIYKVLSLLDMDTTSMLVWSPRVFQGLATAISDYHFYNWLGKSKWALFINVISWFWFYTGSRTLINTFETCLNTIALRYYPWYLESSIYLWPALFCCYIRPTSLVVWLPLILYHLTKTRFIALRLVVRRFIPIGTVVASICIAVDSFVYGRFIVTPYEFMKYNVWHNVGSFYGTHNWYWYFLCGLPVVMGVAFLPFVRGALITMKHRKTFAVRTYVLFSMMLSLAVLSLVEHKEFRFLSPLLPFGLYICVDYLIRWSSKASRLNIWMVSLLLALGNILPSWYFGTIHQRTPIEVMSYLKPIARNYRDEKDNRASIFFLMPCHSTPFYSYIHENVTMRFLTCEPNFNDKDNYEDQAEMFHKAPVRWLRSHIPVFPHTALPSHIVLYAPMATRIADFLAKYDLLHEIKDWNVHINAPSLLDELLFAVKNRNITIFNIQDIVESAKVEVTKTIYVYQRKKMQDENIYGGMDSQEWQNDNNIHLNTK